jgi:hypothetical protein
MRKACYSVLLLLILSGCALFEPQMARRAPGMNGDPEQCLADLKGLGARFEEQADYATPDGCRVVNPVKLLKLKADLNRPASMACPLATALARFEAQAVQPLARQYLNQGVRKIHHVGAYDCRSQRDGKKLSQHGLGMAIDLWAFEMDDGGIIKVRDEWKGSGARATFLKKVADQACNFFHLVLTPASDNDHKDHIHVDLGPWMRCG